MKTTFILALMTAFLTVSTASFASSCNDIADQTRSDQGTVVQSEGSGSGSGSDAETAD